MEWTGIAKVSPEFKKIEESKLVLGWKMSVTSDKKIIEISFHTKDGRWHTFFRASDEQAMMTLSRGGNK